VAPTCGKQPAPGNGPDCADTCGLPAHAVPTGTRFHDLRHFNASSLIRAGLNPKVIQARLGHATIGETMDTYWHLFPEDDDLGRGTFDALFTAHVPAECADGAEQRRKCR
jgi:hypothetical protein